jgi:hypothetical protein
VPTAAGVELEAGAPFIAGTVVAAGEMSFGAKDQRALSAVRRGERHSQRSAAGHTPHDLELLADPRR